jgi:nitrite reductase/ring-hydroxylating ferredoxin subunit
MVSTQTFALAGGEGGRVLQVAGRLLALFEHQSAVYAVDGQCYHAGGPLAQGELVEIESLDRRPCVVCPWHKYMILLDSGEGIYRHAEPGAPAGGPPTYKSKGRKQRIHAVRVRALRRQATPFPHTHTHTHAKA